MEFHRNPVAALVKFRAALGRYQGVGALRARWGGRAASNGHGHAKGSRRGVEGALRERLRGGLSYRIGRAGRGRTPEPDPGKNWSAARAAFLFVGGLGAFLCAQR